jgi:hypothetical protein
VDPTINNGDILKGKKKEMKDFTIKYVSEEKISHLVSNQTKRTRWGESRIVTKNPLPTNLFPVMTFAIKNGEIFKFGSPIGNLYDKWEILHKIIRFTVLKVGSKNPERDQGSE